MNAQLAHTLTQLTSRFYAEVHASFSETRSTAWHGWERVLAEAHPHLPARPNVLDLACGNLRFERFLAEQGVAAASHAYDNCDALALAPADQPASPHAAGTTYHHLDLAAALAEGTLPEQLACPQAHLAVSFGFLHHLPQPEQRLGLLQALVQHSTPGGIVAVSFWQFARSGKLRAKAERTTQEARQALRLPELPENDYLLGWQDTQGTYRYAHHFPEAEVTELAEALGPQATELARFSADGKSNDLNRYLLLHVK